MSYDLASAYPELLKEWDYEKNTLPPEFCSPLSSRKVWWKCDKGHSWQASIRSRSSSGSCCPICSRRRVIKGVKDLATLHPELLKEWDYEKNAGSPEDYSYGSDEKVWWKCDKGHSWQAVIHTRSNGSGCPYCARDRRRKANSEVRP